MTQPASLLSAAILALISTSLVPGQVPVQDTTPRLTFDVASIHPAQPGQRGGMIKPLPGGTGYTVQNMPVKVMISTAYRIPARQITSGPDWLSSDNYDIEARADRSYSLDDLHIMLRNLLADRFNLKFHKEIKQGPVYALSVDKSGLKIKVDPAGPGLDIPITFGKNNDFIGTRVPLEYLCWWLGGQLQSDQRPVVDETGLQNTYDFTLSFAPQLPPGAGRENLPPELQDRPSIFDALKQQLGLKLEPQTGPVEYYVIDHIDKPSAN
jgi:uncharacterized protein (TIGR03435 family)